MRNAVGALRILLSGSGSGARATAAIVLNDLAAMWDFAYGNIRCLPIPLEAPCRSNACGRKYRMSEFQRIPLAWRYQLGKNGRGPYRIWGGTQPRSGRFCRQSGESLVG
jgi:hypothetical protein